MASEAKAGIHTGISGYQNCIYPPMTITSAIAVIIQLHQYDQPKKKPAHGPKYAVAKSAKVLKFVLASNSSPIARITKKKKKPIIK